MRKGHLADLFFDWAVPIIVTALIIFIYCLVVGYLI